jgi:DNA-binding response OmpR family regulator
MKSNNPRQILIVEDDPAILEILTLFLRYEGHEVTCAAGVSEALDRLRHNTFDLVIVDYVLMEDTAEPVVRGVREYQIGHVPIVLLTALDDANSKRSEIDVDHVMTKPFEIDALLSCIEGQLRDPADLPLAAFFGMVRRGVVTGSEGKHDPETKKVRDLS